MSDMHRERDPANYAYGLVDTPFSGGKQNWDRPIGMWCQRAYLWRRVALVNLSASLLLLLLMAWLLTLPQTSVMALQITNKGFVSNWGMLDTHYEIPVTLEKAFLTRYIDDWSGYTADEQLNTENRSFVMSYTAPQAQKLFQQSQADLIPDYLYNVRVKSVQSQSPHVFSVVWNVEKTKPGADYPSLIKAYQGTFDVQRTIPETETALESNPLGFYVSHVSIKPILIGESS